MGSNACLTKFVQEEELIQWLAHRMWHKNYLHLIIVAGGLSVVKIYLLPKYSLLPVLLTLYLCSFSFAASGSLKVLICHMICASLLWKISWPCLGRLTVFLQWILLDSIPDQTLCLMAYILPCLTIYEAYGTASFNMVLKNVPLLPLGPSVIRDHYFRTVVLLAPDITLEKMGCSE